jgi:hypothetical protein
VGGGEHLGHGPAGVVGHDPGHVDAFAHIVLAAANEVTMMIIRADDPAAALSAEESAFAGFLDRLLWPAPASTARV